MNVLKPHLQATVKSLLGKSQREINRKTGVDRKTVRKYGRLDDLVAEQGAFWPKSSIGQQVAIGDQITQHEYEQTDQLHYKVENGMLKLIRSLQKKQKNNEWQDNFSFP